MGPCLGKFSLHSLQVMVNDDVMNLHNWVIPRTFGNDHTRNAENLNERNIVLLVEYETSKQLAQQEPSLVQAFG